MVRMVVRAVLSTARRRGSAQDIFNEFPGRLLAFWWLGLLLLLLLLWLGEEDLLWWWLALCYCTRIAEVL